MKLSTRLATAGQCVNRTSSAMAGGHPLETLIGGPSGNVYSPITGSPKFPSFMAAPAAVVNNGATRTLLYVNEARSPRARARSRFA